MKAEQPINCERCGRFIWGCEGRVDLETDEVICQWCTGEKKKRSDDAR